MDGCSNVAGGCRNRSGYKSTLSISHARSFPFARRRVSTCALSSNRSSRTILSIVRCIGQHYCPLPSRPSQVGHSLTILCSCHCRHSVSNGSIFCRPSDHLRLVVYWPNPVCVCVWTGESKQGLNGVCLHNHHFCCCSSMSLHEC